MPRNEDDQKFQIEAVTSDITYMKETYCIAGWNPSGQHMKRLFIKGKHWEDGDLNTCTIGQPLCPPFMRQIA